MRDNIGTEGGSGQCTAAWHRGGGENLENLEMCFVWRKSNKIKKLDIQVGGDASGSVVVVWGH